MTAKTENMLYSDELTMRDARNLYYKRNGLSADGGASEKIGSADFGPLTVYVPNFPERVRTLQRHDLHHILVDAGTSMTGEAKVGAFECAAGLGFYMISWFLEPQTIVYGLFLDLRGTYEAFRLGRRSRSLFHGPFRDAWLEVTVGDLRRAQLNVNQSNAVSDFWLFLLFSAFGVLELILSLLMLPFTVIFYLLKKAGYE